MNPNDGGLTLSSPIDELDICMRTANALGLVEMREPTPEECEEISRLWYRFEHSSGQSRGREMVDIVRAVMRPKGGEG